MRPEPVYIKHESQTIIVPKKSCRGTFLPNISLLYICLDTFIGDLISLFLAFLPQSRSSEKMLQALHK